MAFNSIHVLKVKVIGPKEISIHFLKVKVIRTVYSREYYTVCTSEIHLRLCKIYH